MLCFLSKKNSVRDITKGLFNVLFEKSKKTTTMDGAMIGLGGGGGQWPQQILISSHLSSPLTLSAICKKVCSSDIFHILKAIKNIFKSKILKKKKIQAQKDLYKKKNYQ